MIVQNKQDVTTGKIIVNLILTKEDVDRLRAGEVISDDKPALSIQVVGYGKE